MMDMASDRIVKVCRNMCRTQINICRLIGTAVPPHLIINMAGIPYLRYSPHLLKAAAAEKPPHVAVGSPEFVFVCHVMYPSRPNT